jgi:hypothetical protein
LTYHFASVKINVDQLLQDRAYEAAQAQTWQEEPFEDIAVEPSFEEMIDPEPVSPTFVSTRVKKPSIKIMETAAGPPSGPSHSSSKKRKASPHMLESAAVKKKATNGGPISITLKMPEPYPCCLCPSMQRDGLLRVHDAPHGIHGGVNGVCMAHEDCAMVIPETWVDHLVVPNDDGSWVTEQRVFGVDRIVKDRWNLVCAYPDYLRTSDLHFLSDRNAPLARKPDRRDMVRLFNVRRASVRKRSTYRVPCLAGAKAEVMPRTAT